MAQSTELLFLLLATLTLAAMLWGMLTDAALVPAWVHRHDKIAHFVAFGVLAAMVHGAWPGHSLVALWLLLTGLGLITEGAQHLTVKRRFCWRDAMANSFGAGCALLVLHFIG